ncbi:MAG: ATP-grasp domain-containing protein [Candidatus Wolfebacteria bacterium]|nr:ATP-grasp domain-containing protein [Candidatus Wolfebacteria bacterium]
MQRKNIILFVGHVRPEAYRSLGKYGKERGVKYKIAVIKDSKIRKPEKPEKKPKKEKRKPDIEILCDLSQDEKISEALHPYENELLAITCRGEVGIQDFIKIIPHVPYLRTPTEKSLLWATDKVLMRRQMRAYDKSIIPKFMVVGNTTKETLKEIKEKVGFPLVLKPANLAASLLVTICFNEEELEKTIHRVFKKIQNIYKENNRRVEPKVLVEQFMEGDMYSIDVYVSSRGKVYFCPLVYVQTGRTVGFDDFFAYKTITPTKLKKTSQEAAEEVAWKAVHALGLRSTTVHIELMRTEDGWKVIELGPRIGGFRHRLYELAFGFDHTLNDIIVRSPQKPVVLKKPKGYAAMVRFFAKEEGTLTSLQGVQKMQELKSYKEAKINKKIGDRCIFAKHGGRGVVEVTLFNESRSELQADIRRLEQTIKIETEKPATNGKVAKKKKK